MIIYYLPLVASFSLKAFVGATSVSSLFRGESVSDSIVGTFSEVELKVLPVVALSWLRSSMFKLIDHRSFPETTHKCSFCSIASHAKATRSTPTTIEAVCKTFGMLEERTSTVIDVRVRSSSTAGSPLAHRRNGTAFKLQLTTGLHLMGRDTFGLGTVLSFVFCGSSFYYRIIFASDFSLYMC